MFLLTFFYIIAGSGTGNENQYKTKSTSNQKDPAAPAAPQLLSKLFPQTAIDKNQEEVIKEQKKSEEEQKKEQEKSWKHMKLGLVVFFILIPFFEKLLSILHNFDLFGKNISFRFLIFGASATILSGWLVYDLGKPEMTADGTVIEDEFSQMPLVKQYLRRMWKSLTYYQKIIQEPSRDKLLPDPLKPPYLQPKYTLVLEMKDVLVHPDWTYQTGWRFKKRPGVSAFLEQLAREYEIVVYTADQGMTVFPILDALDPKGFIMYRLVRDATHFVDGHHVKNLDNLNRDLSKVIVIDWDPNSTKLHPENTFHVERWSGNDDDSTLMELVAFLKSE